MAKDFDYYLAKSVKSMQTLTASAVEEELKTPAERRAFAIFNQVSPCWSYDRLGTGEKIYLAPQIGVRKNQDTIVELADGWAGSVGEAITQQLQALEKLGSTKESVQIVVYDCQGKKREYLYDSATSAFEPLGTH